MNYTKFDYIALGTVGFAQVGRPDYFNKVQVEKRVINTFFGINHRINGLEKYASFRWILCPHDFGSYWDYQIYYNRDSIEELEVSENEEDQIMFAKFWDWANKCENSMSKNEETLMDLMNDLYRKDVTMDIVHRKLIEDNILQKVI